MNKIARGVFSILFFFLVPILAQAQSVNLGIVDGIWFSEDYYVVGDTVRVYTAVQNNSGADITGEVHFFENDELIGIEEFSALDDRIVDVWVDTEAQEGERSFSVSVQNIEGNIPGFDLSSFVPRVSTVQESFSIQVDNDRDRIPDDDDDDDDNDGFSDREEIRRGTNPKDEQSIPEGEEPYVEIDIDQEDISGPIPEVVLDATQQLPLLTPVVSGINQLQNTVVSGVDSFKEQEETNQVNTEGQAQGESLTLSTFKEQGLNLARWIFSCFWCTSIVILAAVYLVIKLLFRLIRS
jgi:hypothetical protein